MRKSRRTVRKARRRQQTKRRGGAGNNNPSTVPTVVVRNLTGQHYQVEGQTVANLRRQMAQELGTHIGRVKIMNRNSMNQSIASAAASASSSNEDEKNHQPLSNNHPLRNGQMYNVLVDEFPVFTEEEMGELMDDIESMFSERSKRHRLRAKERVEELLEQGSLTDVSPVCQLLEGTLQGHEQNDLEDLYYPLIRLLLERRASHRDRWDINQQSDNGSTVLTLLVRLPVAEFVETALALGADPTLEDIEGYTPENWAMMESHNDHLERIHAAIQANTTRRKNNGNRKNHA